MVLSSGWDRSSDTTAAPSRGWELGGQVRMEKSRGHRDRASLGKTGPAKLDDHRRWVGFSMPGTAPRRGHDWIWSRRARVVRGKNVPGELDVAAPGAGG